MIVTLDGDSAVSDKLVDFEVADSVAKDDAVCEEESMCVDSGNIFDDVDDLEGCSKRVVADWLFDRADREGRILRVWWSVD